MTTNAIKGVGSALAALGLSLLFGGCGASSSEVRSDQGGALMASKGTGLDVAPDGARRAAAPTHEQARVPEHVLRSPSERLVFMEQLRRQLVYKTRGISDQRYAQIVRPDLRRQLLAMGLDQQDADVVLADVDYARKRA